MSYPQQARVLFAVLTECVSAGGKAYLRGWAGASNLVAFRGEDDDQGRPTWNLYLAERPPKHDGQGSASRPRTADAWPGRQDARRGRELPSGGTAALARWRGSQAPRQRRPAGAGGGRGP